MNSIQSPRKYEIENFEPYNEIFNGRCFYRALFSVLKHYNVDVMNLLCNNVYHYGLVHDYEDGVYFDYFGLYEKPGLEYKDLLAKSGIRMNERKNVKNIIPAIIDSVSNNKPVIIYIDCYYEPIRRDMYMKIHAVHSIAIYGYDMDTGEFLIIEHDYDNGWEFKQRTLGFEDTERCYRGYVDDGREEYSSFFEFDNDVIADEKPDYLSILKENYINRAEYISGGIKDFEKFIPEDFINKRVQIEKQEESIICMYYTASKILTNQKVRRFALSTAFANNEQIKELIGSITDCWAMFHALINKFRLSPPERRKLSFETCVDNLYNVLNYEKQIHECILKQCEKK